MYARYIKRCFDLVLSLFAIILLFPLLLVIVLLVKIKLGSPVFFKQERVGKDEKIFLMYKFRTMTNKRDTNGELLPDEQRRTRLGSFLRATSLDELPELFSIIKGDMSVIGPRPLPPLYDLYYTDYERKRFEVKGGLVPPEVLYRDIEPSWENQLKYEADYAVNVSAKLDFKILFTAFKGVFIRYSNDYGEYVRKPLSEERFTIKEENK